MQCLHSLEQLVVQRQLLKQLPHWLNKGRLICLFGEQIEDELKQFLILLDEELGMLRLVVIGVREQMNLLAHAEVPAVPVIIDVRIHILIENLQ